MTELARWEAEARRNDMHYGDYVAAVKNGLLPPPPSGKHSATKMPVRERFCRECGCPFEVRWTEAGRYSQATLCTACQLTVRRNNAKSFMQTSLEDTFVCEECGKKVKRGFTVVGKRKHQKLCPECHSRNRKSLTEKAHPTGTCEKCGKHFPLKITPSGSVSSAKFCPECREKVLHSKHISDGDDKYFICADCGGRFERPTDSKGRKTSRRYCDACGGGKKHREKSQPFTSGYTTHTRGR